ncbi:MAG: hypothetical protein ABIP48_07525 [Planctomycetota bacterium]
MSKSPHQTYRLALTARLDQMLAKWDAMAEDTLDYDDYLAIPSMTNTIERLLEQGNEAQVIRYARAMAGVIDFERQVRDTDLMAETLEP